MKYVIYLCVCAVLMLSSSSVLADTVSYDTTFSGISVGSSSSVSLSKFDPSLGPLQSVLLTLEANTSGGSITWDNESASETHVTLGIGATVTATGPDALAVVAIPLQTGESDVLADEDGDPDFTGDDAFTVSSGTGEDSDSDYATNFSPYIGAGETFNVSLASIVETSVATSGGQGDSTSSGWVYGGKVTVTYTYTPEPAAMSLVAVGGLALLRRRRRGA